MRAFWFGEVELAPLALFRILYGLQLLNWVWQLFPNLRAFFTDEGILPRRELLAGWPDRFSLLVVASEWWQVALLWLAACAIAVLLTVGWRTRLMCFLAFVAVTSFSWRNPLILDGSDFVFRVVPLWMMFTRAGDLYSVDAFLRGGPVTGRAWAFPVRVLELQIAWIYLATGIEKLAGTEWPNGTAAYYALQLEHTFGRWWARPIALEPTLVRVITWGTLLVELAFLPLAMLPSRVTRLAAAAAAAGLHLGIFALMNVGNFPVIMLSALVLFLPPEWVRWYVRDDDPRPAAPPAPARPRLAALALAGLATISLGTAVPRQFEPLRPSGEIGSALRFLSLDQRWDMFSPDPARSDGWMRGPARLEDGTAFDLFTGGPPDDRSERYSDPLYTRWAKVHERVASVGMAAYRLEYARHFCRTRNLHLRPGQVPLDSFELYYTERVIRPPGEAPLIIEHKLWSHEC